MDQTYYVTLAAPDGGVAEVVQRPEDTESSFDALVEALAIWMAAGFDARKLRHKLLRVFAVPLTETGKGFVYLPTHGELTYAVQQATLLAEGPKDGDEDEGAPTDVLLAYYDGDPTVYEVA